MDVLPSRRINNGGAPGYFVCSQEGDLDCLNKSIIASDTLPYSSFVPDGNVTDQGTSNYCESTSLIGMKGCDDESEFDVDFIKARDSTVNHARELSDKPNARCDPIESDTITLKPIESSLASTPCSSDSTKRYVVVAAGLGNIVNSCFLNSILQCLTHTVPLVHSFRSKANHSTCELFCAYCCLRDHIEFCINSSGMVINPCILFGNLTNISPHLRPGSQEDAHEFLQCLFAKLESGCLSSKPESINLVEDVFGGSLISKLSCTKCGYFSKQDEPFNNMSLEIQAADDLESALESFTSVEKIDDADARCENCHAASSMEKQLILDQLPRVAVFHLKRFQSDGFSIKKITKHVSFPLEINLNPFTTSANEADALYTLYAFVVHNGSSPVAGHYIAYVRTAPDTWHQLDDAQVTAVDEEFVISKHAYILFYAEKGSPWFRYSVEAIGHTLPISVLDDVVQPALEPKPEPEPGSETPSGAPITLLWDDILCSPTDYDRVEVKGDVSTSYETPGSKSKVRGEWRTEDTSASKKGKMTPEMVSHSEAIKFLNKSAMSGNRKSSLLTALLQSDGAKKRQASCKKSRSPHDVGQPSYSR